MKISRFRSEAVSLATALLCGAAMVGQATAEDAAQKAPLGPVVGPEINEAKAALGKRLFFDARISADSAISCATCHNPEFGFGMDTALSFAYPGTKGFRNSPTLINTALAANWFHDGRLGVWFHNLLVYVIIAFRRLIYGQYTPC